jgi:hypothetical protein
MTPHPAITIVPIRDATSPALEPTVDELMNDPMVEAVMRADRVDTRRLKAMLNRVAGELDARQQPSPFGFEPGAALARSFVFLPHGYPGNCPNEPNPQ